MKTSFEYVQDHQKQYPACTQHTCPHQLNFMAKVIFEEPDNGFICTVQGFDDESAIATIREGVTRDFPKLTIKSIEVKLTQLQQTR